MGSRRPITQPSYHGKFWAAPSDALKRVPYHKYIGKDSRHDEPGNLAHHVESLLNREREVVLVNALSLRGWNAVLARGQRGIDAAQALLNLAGVMIENL